MRRLITIAIDGPAGAGKSTTARAVARALGYTFIDSGAMYRAVTLKVLREKVAPDAEEEVAAIAQKLKIELRPNNERTVIAMDGEDVSAAIRTPEVAKNISPVARNPRVREELVKRQQEMGRAGGVVMDGRDIGTVVFPFAELKVFMTASVAERAKRRVEEHAKQGKVVPLEEVKADIEKRDHQDRNRPVGALKPAEDSITLNTDGLTIEEQVGKVVDLAKETIERLSKEEASKKSNDNSN